MSDNVKADIFVELDVGNSSESAFAVDVNSGNNSEQGIFVQVDVGNTSLPKGGEPGQVLTKTEGGAEWKDATGGGGSLSEVPVASETVLGGVKVGKNLTIDKNGVLSVDTAEKVERDNSLPITSAAVFVEVGNINTLLETI